MLTRGLWPPPAPHGPEAACMHLARLDSDARPPARCSCRFLVVVVANDCGGSARARIARFVSFRSVSASASVTVCLLSAAGCGACPYVLIEKTKRCNSGSSIRPVTVLDGEQAVAKICRSVWLQQASERCIRGSRAVASCAARSLSLLESLVVTLGNAYVSAQCTRVARVSGCVHCWFDVRERLRRLSRSVIVFTVNSDVLSG